MKEISERVWTCVLLPGNRIDIAQEIIEELGWKPGTRLVQTVEGRGIIIRSAAAEADGELSLHGR